MKLTQGMKKALSLLLSAAMVVTGVNVTTNSASAAGTTPTSLVWNGAYTGVEWSVEKNQLETTEGSTLEVEIENEQGVKFNVSSLNESKVTLSATTKTEETTSNWTTLAFKNAKGDILNTSTNGYSPEIKDEVITITAENVDVPDDGVFYLYFTKRTVTNITVTVATEEPDATATAPAPTEVASNPSPSAVTASNPSPSAVTASNPSPSAVTASNPSPSAVTASNPSPSAVADAQPSAPADDAQPSAPADDAQPSAPAAENPSPSAVAASEAPAETEVSPEQDTAFLMFTDGNWSWGNWNTKVNGGFGNDAVITDNGDYSVSIDADGWKEYNEKKETENFSLSAADGATVFCVDIQGLCNSPNLDISEMKVSNLKIYADNKSISVNTANVKMGDIEGKGNFRIDIYNAYGPTADDPAIDETEITFEKSLKVSFTLSGIKKGTSKDAFQLDTTGDGNNDTYVSLDDAVDEWSDEGEADPEPLNPVATLTPVEDTTEASAAPADTNASAAPADTTTSATPASGGATSATPASGGATTATTTAVTTSTTAVKATGKITVAKSLVVVAPGKSATVKFTAKKAKGASSAAVVKATSKSKKVAKVAVKGSKVKITVPKKAVKGASTQITLKSENSLTGKAASATVKVYVRNTAKKVKAAKKSITVKKKKTVKLVLNASGKIQNKKKPVAETVTVQGKVVKLTAVKYAKKKITVTLQGVKKAKNKAVTIKVGTKKVKVKVTVK